MQRTSRKSTGNGNSMLDAPSLHRSVDILQTIPAESPRVQMLDQGLQNLASQEGLTIQPHDLQDLLAQKQIQAEDFHDYLLAVRKQQLANPFEVLNDAVSKAKEAAKYGLVMGKWAVKDMGNEEADSTGTAQEVNERAKSKGGMVAARQAWLENAIAAQMRGAQMRGAHMGGAQMRGQYDASKKAVTNKGKAKEDISSTSNDEFIHDESIHYVQAPAAASIPHDSSMDVERRLNEENTIEAKSPYPLWELYAPY